MFDGERLIPKADTIPPQNLLTVVGTMENGSHGLIDRSAYFVDAEGLIFIASDALVIDEKMFQASFDDQAMKTFIEDFFEDDEYGTLSNDDFCKIVRIDGEYILIDTLSCGLHVPTVCTNFGVQVNTYITDPDQEKALISVLDKSIDGLANDFNSLQMLAVSLVQKTIEHLDLEED